MFHAVSITVRHYLLTLTRYHSGFSGMDRILTGFSQVHSETIRDFPDRGQVIHRKLTASPRSDIRLMLLLLGSSLSFT
jgi:hypothetical protein